MASRVWWMKGASHVNMKTFNKKNRWRAEILSFFWFFPRFTFHFQILFPQNADLWQKLQFSLLNKMMERKQIEWLETCCRSQRGNQYEPLKHLLHDRFPSHRSSMQPFATRLSFCVVISYTWPINYMINMYDGGGAGLLVQGRLHWALESYGNADNAVLMVMSSESDPVNCWVPLPHYCNKLSNKKWWDYTYMQPSDKGKFRFLF